MVKKDNKPQNPSHNIAAQGQKRPQEKGAFDIQAHLKIFDPKTKHIYVEGRA